MSSLRSVKEINHFFNALSNEKSISFDSKGRWSVRKKWHEKIYHFFFSRTSNLISVSRRLSAVLDAYENTPFAFETKVSAQKEKVESLLKVGNLIKSRLATKISKAKPSKRLTQSVDYIEKRLIALKYRAESVNGGIDTRAPDEALFGQLSDAAEKWVQTRRPATYTKLNGVFTAPSPLTNEQKEQLKSVLKYPEFFDLLLRSQGVRNDLFKWVLVNKCPVEAFVEFPAIIKKISLSLLHKRVSAFSPSILRIAKKKAKNEIDNSRIKVLTLPFEVEGGSVKQVSLLNGSQSIRFNTSTNMTLDNVFKEFKEKRIKAGSLEMMDGKIALWDTNEIEAGKSNWREELKPYKTVTLAEMQARFPDIDLQEGEFLTIPRGSRVDENLNFNQTHGLLEMAVPIEGGMYQLYPFGKIAKKYPQKPVEKLGYLAGTYHARIMYPDENVYYTHRQHAAYPIKISEAESDRIFELIQEDIMSARKNNEIFQLAYYNCADWVQTTLEKALGKKENGGKVPNLFRMPIMNSTPKKPGSYLFNALRKSPKIIRKGIFFCGDVFLGSWKGVYTKKNNKKSYRCLMGTEFRKTRMTSHSALLFEKIISNELSGTIV